jgi:peptidoglycan hydrolase-like protein with peptidoglycan-binding domain
MAQAPKERTDQITPRAVGASLGSAGEDVDRLQKFLGRFGYFDSGVHARFGMRPVGAEPMPAKAGEFDDRTENALKMYQAFNKLPVTGQLDQNTLERMQRRRCGFPDVGAPGVGEFVAQGNKWTTNSLRYGFVEFTSDLTQAQIRDAISTALSYWAAVTPLTFSEIPNASNPEIRIRFVTGDHGDGSPFDGGGGVLAHAFYPPPNGGDIAGDTHFDDAENWSVNLPPSGIDLVTVAAHEFGHALGLNHSPVNDALMYAYYGGPHRFLHQDDIDGIQSIYGAQQWFSSKLIQLCFATYHSKNAWAYIEGVGWRKIRPQTTDGVTNMFYAACEARANNVRTTVLVADDLIEQMYV